MSYRDQINESAAIVAAIVTDDPVKRQVVAGELVRLCAAMVADISQETYLDANGAGSEADFAVEKGASLMRTNAEYVAQRMGVEL